MSDPLSRLVEFVRDQYQTKEFIPLHAPRFQGKERDYVLQTIDSTFVSSVGAFVDRFEAMTKDYTGSPRAVATVNGTAALQVALDLCGVLPGDLVITQPLSFIATANAIAHCGAEPVFVDVDRNTLGLSATALENWLEEQAERREQGSVHRASGRVLRACVPMHTFGHPADLAGLLRVCWQWGIPLVEDAAESLGSFYQGQHTGTFGRFGTLSYNGNKIVTTGGGGMILCADAAEGARAKHLTTTAKKPHPYEFVHDAVGYNYRLPNLNAALGCAQMEQLPSFLEAKRALALRYQAFLEGGDYRFVEEPAGARSNYWLNAVIAPDSAGREALLHYTNAQGVMTRPIWQLLSRSEMYRSCLRGPLENAEWLEARVVNLPSSVP